MCQGNPHWTPPAKLYRRSARRLCAASIGEQHIQVRALRECPGAPDSFTEFFRARQNWRNRLLSL